MIDGLVSGKLFGAATSRQGRGGGEFVTCKVRTAVDAGEAMFVNVIAFSSTAGAALLALGDGDAVALAGALTPKAWTDKHGDAKPGLDMVAHTVLTVYHVKRKRSAVRGDGAGVADAGDRPAAVGEYPTHQGYGGTPAHDMNDDL